MRQDANVHGFLVAVLSCSKISANTGRMPAKIKWVSCAPWLVGTGALECRLENVADQTYRQAIASLFEGDHSAADLIKWREIYEVLENTTDRCEDVADVVESIALKRRVIGL